MPGQSSISTTARVSNKILDLVKKLDDLCDSGKSHEVMKGLELIIEAIERGESFGDAAIAKRLENIEQSLQELTAALRSPTTVTIILKNEALESVFFKTPSGELRFSTNAAVTIPRDWVPILRDQIKQQGYQPFKTILEVL